MQRLSQEESQEEFASRRVRGLAFGGLAMTWSASSFRSLLRGLALLALGLAACTPKIGHQCVLSTDCGTQGGLVCDPTVPGGYCTLTNCQMNLCPNEAACVLFQA